MWRLGRDSVKSRINLPRVGALIDSRYLDWILLSVRDWIDVNVNSVAALKATRPETMWRASGGYYEIGIRAIPRYVIARPNVNTFVVFDIHARRAIIVAFRALPFNWMYMLMAREIHVVNTVHKGGGGGKKNHEAANCRTPFT